MESHCKESSFGFLSWTINHAFCMVLEHLHIFKNIHVDNRSSDQVRRSRGSLVEAMIAVVQ